MHRFARLCLLPLLPLTLADSLEWSPAEGAELTKTFHHEGASELTDFWFSIDGEDMTAMAGDLYVESISELTVVVADECVAVDEGRVEHFRRTFDTIGMTTEFEMTVAGSPVAQETPAVSELEGATVEFRWDAEADEWQKSFDDESEVVPDEALLAGLVADMDMQILLPDEPVEAGDSWEVDISELMALLQPGGNLGLVPAGMEDMGVDLDQVTTMIEDVQERFVDEFANWGDGGFVCTYRGTRSEDRGTIGVVGLELDMTVEADLTALLNDLLASITEEVGMPIEIDIHSAVMDGSASGSGELTWNIDTGQLDASTLDASYEATFEFEVEGGTDAQTSLVECAFSLEGSQLYEATTE